ncbi:hypothetical protein LAX80_000115 [Listeria marthii]|nr:hypothetical protein LAX80_000115 [Listeria marthii]
MYGSSPRSSKIESYDYYAKQEQQRLQAKLANKDKELSSQERADIIAAQMECSFESKTGHALKDWMTQYRSYQIVPNENLIYDCKASLKLDK